jgi:putative peptide zinc metalloprotease protein
MTYAIPIADTQILEKDNINSIVPSLATNIEIYPFDEYNYVVQQKEYGFNIKVNRLTYSLLIIIDGQKTLKDLANELSLQWAVNISVTQIHKLLFSGKLTDCGIIITNKVVVVTDKANYLKLRFTIIPAKVLYKITHRFTILFEKRFFYWSSVSMLLFIGICFLQYEKWSLLFQAISPQNIIIFYTVVLMSAFLHELGHSSACRRFGATHGDIGFGFYLITPVLYADVSDAWKLPKHERLIIDMAGVYMEIILCSICCIVFLFTHQLGFLHIAILKLLGTQGNLNPFIRADAYWAISDWFNIPNLKAKSDQKMIAFSQWVFQKKTFPLKISIDYFLLGYALISWIFIGIFLTTVLFYNSQSVLYFPYHLGQFLFLFFTKFPIISFDWLKTEVVHLILPFIFYLMAFNLLKRRLSGIKETVILKTRQYMKNLTIFLCFGIFLIVISCNDSTDFEYNYNIDSKPMNTIEQNFALNGFDKVVMGSAFIVDIKEGNTFIVKATGDSIDIGDLQYSLKNNILHFKYSRTRQHRKAMKFEITLPILKKVTFNEASSGNIECKGKSSEIEVSLSSASHYNLTGEISKINASVIEASYFNTYQSINQETVLNIDGVSQAKILANKSLNISAKGVSKVWYKGNPSTSIKVSDLSQVIKE